MIGISIGELTIYTGLSFIAGASIAAGVDILKMHLQNKRNDKGHDKQRSDRSGKVEQFGERVADIENLRGGKRTNGIGKPKPERG